MFWGVQSATYSLMTAPQYACKIPLVGCNTPLYDCKFTQCACNILLPICNILLTDLTIPLYDSKPCKSYELTIALRDSSHILITDDCVHHCSHRKKWS